MSTDKKPTVHPGETLEQPIPADPIPTSDPAAAARTKTFEEWAKERGMFHEFTEGKRSPKAKPKSKPPMVHNPKYVRAYRARKSQNIPVNMPMTEAEFDQALATADGHVYRSHSPAMNPKYPTIVK